MESKSRRVQLLMKPSLYEKLKAAAPGSVNDYISELCEQSVGIARDAPSTLEQCYTLAEIEAQTNIPRYVLLGCIRRGELKAAKVAHCWRVSRDNLLTFLNVR